MLFIFSMPVLIRYKWQLMTVVFLHWCLIRSVLLGLETKLTFTKQLSNFLVFIILAVVPYTETDPDI